MFLPSSVALKKIILIYFFLYFFSSFPSTATLLPFFFFLCFSPAATLKAGPEMHGRQDRYCSRSFASVVPEKIRSSLLVFKVAVVGLPPLVWFPCSDRHDTVSLAWLPCSDRLSLTPFCLAPLLGVLRRGSMVWPLCLDSLGPSPLFSLPCRIAFWCGSVARTV